MSWFKSNKNKSSKQLPQKPKKPAHSFVDQTVTSNMRALKLAMTAGDVLLSMGIPASRVVSRCLDITETYCQTPVHVDVNANVIMLSQIRDVDKEPLTLIRPIVERSINNMTIQSIQYLIYRIKNEKLSLAKAEAELDEIIRNPKTYPDWIVTAGQALIAAGVTLMYTSSWRIVLVAFVISVVVIKVLSWLKNRGITSFFRIVAAAMVATFAASMVRLLNDAGVSFFAGMNPTIIVVGGIIMLVSGLMIVGAIWDAIEEFYVTANARLLRVVLQTMGIVVGILIGLYIARKMGVGIAVSPDPLSSNTFPFQVTGGAIAAAGYAISAQTRIRAFVWAASMGALALAVLYLTRQAGFTEVAASGIAALPVGLLATMFSRYWRTPSVGAVAAGILPLAPGLALYNALMQLVNYPPGDPLFYKGLGALFMVFATALSIAIGASLGSTLARPLHQRLTYVRNVQPFLAFMRTPLTTKQRKVLADFALSRSLDRLLSPIEFSEDPDAVETPTQDQNKY